MTQETPEKNRPNDYSRRQFCKIGLSAAAGAAYLAAGGLNALAASFSGDELIYMSAEELIPLFEAGKLSPVDVLKAQISRYEVVGQKVNSVTYTHFDTAMAQAEESEKRYKNGTARALEGITVGIKDEHHDAGWIVTQGSTLFKNSRKDHADPIVQKLKEAGAVLNIQTTVPEFYLNGATWSKLWGVTRNAWNLKYAVGGSSGGSGGSLAAGLCTLATGSDMAGSVRLPCAFNGLYGFKPPFGRVATTLPLAYFSGTGPLARSFADMALMQNAISGQTPHEPATLPKLVMPLDYKGIKGLRIAYTPNLGLSPIDRETKEGMKQAMEVFRGLGATVEEVKIDPGFDGDEIDEIFYKGALSGSMGGLFGDFADKADQMSSYAANFMESVKSSRYGPASAKEYEDIIKRFYAQLSDQVFEKKFDALIMPTTPTPHVPADYDMSKPGYILEGQEVNPTFIIALTLPWNFLNWCPVVVAPTILSSQGIPMGMQIIGKSYDDLKVFQIAHAYGAAAPRLYRGELMPDFRGA